MRPYLIFMVALIAFGMGDHIARIMGRPAIEPTFWVGVGLTVAAIFLLIAAFIASVVEDAD